MKRKLSFLFIFAIGLTTNSYCQTSDNATPTASGISIRPQFNTKDAGQAQYLKSNYCDPSVYDQLYSSWRDKAVIAIGNTRGENAIREFRDQEPKPSDYATGTGACGFGSVFGPVNQIGKQASTVMAIMQGNVPWDQIQQDVQNQIMNQACQFANNYAGQIVQNATGGLTGGMGGGLNTAVNMLNGAASIQTPIGTINGNVGSSVLNAANNAASQANPTATFGGAVNQAGGIVDNLTK